MVPSTPRRFTRSPCCGFRGSARVVSLARRLRNDAALAQLLDLLVVIAHLTKDLLRVLAQGRGGALNLAWGLLEVNGYACQADRTDCRMVNDWVHAHCLDLWMVEELLIRRYHPTWEAFPD